MGWTWEKVYINLKMQLIGPALFLNIVNKTLNQLEKTKKWPQNTNLKHYTEQLIASQEQLLNSFFNDKATS